MNDPTTRFVVRSDECRGDDESIAVERDLVTEALEPTRVGRYETSVRSLARRASIEDEHLAGAEVRISDERPVRGGTSDDDEESMRRLCPRVFDEWWHNERF